MRYQHFGLAYPRNPVQLHGKRDTKCTQEELLFWVWNGLMAERNVLVISNRIHDRKPPTKALLTAAIGFVTNCFVPVSTVLLHNGVHHYVIELHNSEKTVCYITYVLSITQLRLAQKIAQQ